MRVNELWLKNFRSYAESRVEFAPDVNVIAGNNAQGKTNLLEAVYLLTAGRSFRTRTDAELISFGAETAHIEANVLSGARIQNLKLSIRRGGRKTIKINGSAGTAASLSGTLRSVLFRAEDLELIRGGASGRRRMLDTAISQLRPGYQSALSEYNRLFSHKTRILRDWRDKPSLLEALDDFSHRMCEIGAVLIRYRAAYITRLAQSAETIHHDFSNNREMLNIIYKTVSTVINPLAPLTEITRHLHEHQKEHRDAELKSGLCLSGAHKDDMDISIDDAAARAFASQGQARTAALSMKMAERDICLQETGDHPILLLDDVLSELDMGRQEFVLNRVGGGQTLITCCEDKQIAGRTGGTTYTVENGTISAS